MTEPLSPQERANILRMAGLEPESDATMSDIGVTSPSTEGESDSTLIDAIEADLDEIGRTSVSEKPKPAKGSVPKRGIKGVIKPDIQATPESSVAPTWAIDEIVTLVCTNAHGNKDAALAAVDAHVQGEFDRLKLSKVQAAMQGLDEAGKREHNANAWKHAQGVGAAVKTGVRKVFRDQGGFVAAKITKGKPSVVEQFVRDHENSEVVQAFLRMMEEGTSE